MGWLLLLCLLVSGVTAVMPDGLAINYQPRLPTQELRFTHETAPPVQTTQPWYQPFVFWQSDRDPQSSASSSGSNLAQPTPPYRYILFHKGPVKITRYSLELGLRLGTWLFTLIYGTALYLLTTAPEEITVALEVLLQPLKRWRVPITEVTLTLTLSLRFIPLVLEEIQNLIRAIRTRAINWKKLGIRGTIQLCLLLADRLIENLFLRADQVASAMTVRGFTSPNHHQVKWHQLRIRWVDQLALVLVVLVCGLRIWFGFMP
jgi:energy-coupling factor transport system permease protein